MAMQEEFESLEQHPYSSDLAPSHFPKLKESLKESKFFFNEDMLEAVKARLAEQTKIVFLKV